MGLKMKCTVCGTEMKPLAFSVYCPNDCDRIVAESIETEKTPRFTKPNLNGTSFPVIEDVYSLANEDDSDLDWGGIFDWGTPDDSCTITIKFTIEL